MFFLAANRLISLADVPSDVPLHDALTGVGVTDYCRGGSAIAAPDGTWVVEPVADVERLVVADIDLRRVAEERVLASRRPRSGACRRGPPATRTDHRARKGLRNGTIRARGSVRAGAAP